MHSLVLTIPVGLVAVVLFSGCSAPAPNNVVFKTQVELQYANPDCDADPSCWLPVQFAPKLTSGESVSLFEQWPVKGDTVSVVCEITGESLQDYTGRNTDKWYGIIVPRDKLETKLSSSKDAQPIEGGYMGYVSALWLDEVSSTAPACE